MAQFNHPSIKAAMRVAQDNIEAGADLVSVAVPRLFNLPENSLKEYLSDFLSAVPETPVSIRTLIRGVHPSVLV